MMAPTADTSMVFYKLDYFPYLAADVETIESCGVAVLGAYARVRQHRIVAIVALPEGQLLKTHFGAIVAQNREAKERLDKKSEASIDR